MTTDYEYAARESQVAGLEQGARRVLADMTTDEKLTELLWILRRGQDECVKMVESASKNPMLSMIFKK